MKDIHPGLVAEATLRDGVYWFLPEHAVAVIREARQHGLPLLGIDAAFLTPATTRPSPEDGWDYSTSPVPDRYLHAFQFIKERASKGLRFEIVLGDG
jgi:hypothetical protein